MEKTKVKAYFSLFGDDFPLDVVTEQLGIKPTMAYRKGDVIKRKSSIKHDGRVHYRKETAWDLGMDYEESLDVDDQLSKIINVLSDKREVIVEIQNRFCVECKLFIVIIVEEGLTPVLFLNKRAIDFAHAIHAEIDIDLYAGSYK
ncbi:DUF4279 domain-containing protein [Paenibacillus sp. SC116]|uniref:DUF4279 domain-containing protein n=1 Tax=Paenibacillus sp. SC116 TaxID=2968986 RepID=UPI00215B6175|nr:DUF4279 domain-containing protein [Paenibacillus sp. SC116]MCR8842638.1 DUF4279 domain-containing protein [Paenibacillus sp. SC116]